jgi:branched-chain amino acid transport system substrate-binding protein
MVMLNDNGKGSGGGKSRIDTWDGSKWVPRTDWFANHAHLGLGAVMQYTSELAKFARK